MEGAVQRKKGIGVEVDAVRDHVKDKCAVM